MFTDQKSFKEVVISFSLLPVKEASQARTSEGKEEWASHFKIIEMQKVLSELITSDSVYSVGSNGSNRLAILRKWQKFEEGTKGSAGGRKGDN